MSWDLTFIFEQELCSKSMNDILRGVIRPGVFNPNMYLYTKDNGNTPGVYLKILAGTTLVFSNGKKITAGIHNRDLDDIGEYVIKAVATADIDELLMATESATALFSSVGGNGAPYAPILYVGAEYLYDPDVAGNTSISITIYRPNYPNATTRATN